MLTKIQKDRNYKKKFKKFKKEKGRRAVQPRPNIQSAVSFFIFP
jgi:hypothetical protein